MTLFEEHDAYEDIYFAGTIDAHCSAGSPVPIAESLPCSGNDLRVAFSLLTARQRYVLELFWGLGGRERQSFRQIGDAMGTSHQAIAKHYRLGMTKLRATLSSTRVDGFV